MSSWSSINWSLEKITRHEIKSQMTDKLGKRHFLIKNAGHLTTLNICTPYIKHGHHENANYIPTVTRVVTAISTD